MEFLVKEYLTPKGVSYKNFMTDIRGRLNEYRFQAIQDAFRRVRKVAGDRITL